MPFDTTPGASGYFMPHSPQGEIDAAKRDVPVALTHSTGQQNWHDWNINWLVSDLMHEYKHLEPAARWAIHELVQDQLLTVNNHGVLINLPNAKLWEWRRAVDETRARDDAAIIYHGNACYSVLGHDPVAVTPPEDVALRSFIETPAMELETLKKQSGVSRPDVTLKQLMMAYDARFAPYIRLPGGKRKGGYHVKIRRAP